MAEQPKKDREEHRQQDATTSQAEETGRPPQQHLQQQAPTQEISSASAALAQLQALANSSLFQPSARTTDDSLTNVPPSPLTAGVTVPHHLQQQLHMMNYHPQRPGTLEEALAAGASSVPGSQRQLLSALLSEGISANRTTQAPSLQALEALQSPASVDRTQALTTVNRALQEQLLMSELLRSPAAAQRAAAAGIGLPQHLLPPAPPFQGGSATSGGGNTNPGGNAASAAQGAGGGYPSNISNQNLLASSTTAAPMGALPGSIDLLRAQPQLGLLAAQQQAAAAGLGQLPNPGGIGGPPLFGGAGLGHVLPTKTAEAGGEAGAVLKRPPEESAGGPIAAASASGAEEKDAQDKEENRGRMLPPRKRRKKMVNFKLDDNHPSSSSEHSSSSSSSSSEGALQRARDNARARFPLPQQQEKQPLLKIDAPPLLVNYKNFWENLRKAKGRKEFFRRRLHKGNIPIAK